MSKVIRIPNVDGFVMTDRGIMSTTSISCFMELHIEEDEMWICVNEVEGSGGDKFVCNEFTWYSSIQAIQKVVG